MAALLSPKEADTRLKGEFMPAYYFHVRENGALLRDTDGLELPDFDAVCNELKRLIISVLQEEQMTEEFSANREFQVDDEHGRTVLVVPFRLAVSRPPEAGR